MLQSLKKSLDTSSWVTLLLLLVVGGVKADVRAIYLSSLAMAWKGARQSTQYIQSTNTSRALQAAVTPLQAENLQLKVSVGNAKGEIEALEATNKLYVERVEESEKVAIQLQDQIKSLENNLYRAEERVKAAQVEVEAREDKIKEWENYAVELETVARARDQVERDRLQIKVDEINRLNIELKERQARYLEGLSKAHADVDQAKDELGEARAQVAFLQAEIERITRPRTLGEGTPENDLANALVDWFGCCKPAIVLDAESATVSGIDWKLVFNLRDKKQANRVRERAQELKIDFSLSNLPAIKIEGDKVRITILRGELPNEAKYLKVDPDWLREALVFEKSGRLVTHHARFSGSTETGKSTLVCNAVGVLIQRIPLIEIELGDPLIAGQSQWTTLPPKFKGEEACVAGLMAFYAEFQALDRGETTSDRSKVFILDEFDRMMERYPHLLPIVLDLWKSGRHQKRYFWALGQSALVGKFNLNMEDVQNVIGFYLGNTVERGLADANDDPAYNSALRQEWHMTKARELRYVCLCRPMTVKGRPFLAIQPKPDTFALKNVNVGTKLLDAAREEERLDVVLSEFDVDSTRENLERLLNQGSEVSEPTVEGFTPTELKQARTLIQQGLTASKIVKEVWGLSPNKSNAYKSRKALIEKLQKSMKKGKD